MKERDILYLEYLQISWRWNEFRDDFEKSLNSMQKNALEEYDRLMKETKRQQNGNKKQQLKLVWSSSNTTAQIRHKTSTKSL